MFIYNPHFELFALFARFNVSPVNLIKADPYHFCDGGKSVIKRK